MKIFIRNLIVTAIGVIACYSCTSHSPETITEGEILDIVNQGLKDNVKDIKYEPLQIGTYECNDNSDRKKLLQLQSAGLITYNVERLAWWEKSFKDVKQYRTVTEWIGWYSYETQKPYWTKKATYDFKI